MLVQVLLIESTFAVDFGDARNHVRNFTSFFSENGSVAIKYIIIFIEWFVKLY